MIKDSLYAKYIKEREDLEILESESGFVTYKVSSKECFIKNMCIDLGSRRSGKARDLIKELEKIAGGHACEFISANVDLKDKGASNTLIASLLIGFKVVAANGDTLLIIKDLRGS